jgi:hypothetical protein
MPVSIGYSPESGQEKALPVILPKAEAGGLLIYQDS